MAEPFVNYKAIAQPFVNYAIELLGVQFDSDGKAMTRSECLPKARMIARAMLAQKDGAAWRKAEAEIDRCF